MNSKVYTILQLCDSAFPTGGFSHSMGSEAALQHHQIRNKDDLKIFILSSMENTGSLYIPFVRVAHEAYKEIDKLSYLDSLLSASLLNHVAYRASKQQGKSFLTTTHQVFPLDEILAIQKLVEDEKLHGHLAIVFAVVCASLNIPAIQVGQMFLFNALRTTIASFVRLGKIGAIQAQEYQYEVQKLLDGILNRHWKTSPEDSYIAYPLPEVIQNIHDTLFTKLFYS